jgi:hypothetical protein
MASVILWMCPCGTRLKAVHSTPGSTLIECANPHCSTTYAITGHVHSLFVEDENGKWHDLPVDTFDRESPAAPGIQAAS